jgi:uncharacterized membrane protein
MAVVLAATTVTLLAGLVVKAPCASGEWGKGIQYTHLCYSDLVPLFGTEHLDGGRLPYIDHCPREAGQQCDEYPVLTMWFMRVAAWIGPGYAQFFFANVALLAAAALITAALLYRMAGARALYFAIAPTLLIYGFMNWDLFAVSLATGATFAFFKRKDGWAGALLGLGAAAKLFPALLLVPFALTRWRSGERRQAGVLAGWTVGAYVAVNLPFALAAPHQWETFFRFNTQRPVDWDSLWFITCHGFHAATSCGLNTKTVNIVSLAAFGVAAYILWVVRSVRQPDFPAWTFGFPILVTFLLANKVYSPQYGLWLLPWFALALPNPWLFGLFELADVAVFVTRFTWFGRLGAETGDPAFAGYHGAPLWAFETAVLLRALVLIACLVVWALGERGRHGVPARAAPSVEPRLLGAPT